MLPDTPPRPRIRHVASAGTALALSLAPVVIGVLLAKTLATDPMSPVNALVTRGGQGVPVPPAQWRGCGRQALRDWKSPLAPLARSRGGAGRSGVPARWCSAVRRVRRRRPLPAER
ncbi:hypothetical protein ACFU6R_03650 [Streptomyces sp. NPDC057499]|uniref:hypothetical protein n=1 Tax=Streptomyces sp. NPDC057499 TaxID=3346150 RepID=UPI0036A4B9FC